MQLDIAKKLLKLRATFQENSKVNKTFRVDFKLPEVDKVIMLKGKEHVNARTGELYGIPGLKQRFLNRRLPGWELVVIDVEKWKALSEEEQLTYLYQLTRTQSNKAYQQQAAA